MTPEELLRRLEAGPLLLDGGMGSRLIEAGLPAGRAPERWVLEHPEIVEEVHRSYAEAGSDILHSCTFGASPPKLAQAGLAGRCDEINRRAVQLTRAATSDRVLIAGDIGPTGLLRPPMGTARAEEYEPAFHQQVQALVEAGVDLLSIETMYDLQEALVAVRLAAGTGLAVLASMTFEVRRRGVFTIMGDDLAASLRGMLQAGATAVGLNCGQTAHEMEPLVPMARAVVPAPLVVQPNAGSPRPTPDGVVYDADPREFVRSMLAMIHQGARVVGGCCGTDARFIVGLREALSEQP